MGGDMIQVVTLSLPCLNFAKLLRRAHAELHAAVGFHPETDRNDDIEGGAFDVSGYLASAPCCKKCNSGFVALEEVGDVASRKPDGFVDEKDVDARLPVPGLEENYFAGSFIPTPPRSD
jgi:hypothetical protein